ncbi:MAG: hypothetical protein H6656_10245 [Ardenticatenaceae bacterium]|nr:hypothetical protein [Ardenticatenaceae bacterium]
MAKTSNRLAGNAASSALGNIAPYEGSYERTLAYLTRQRANCRKKRLISTIWPASSATRVIYGYAWGNLSGARSTPTIVSAAAPAEHQTGRKAACWPT